MLAGRCVNHMESGLLVQGLSPDRDRAKQLSSHVHIQSPGAGRMYVLAQHGLAHAVYIVLIYTSVVLHVSREATHI